MKLGTYICSVCKKEEKISNSPLIHYCNDCKSEICEYCFIGPFCLDHCKDLIPEAFLKLKQLIKAGTNKRDQLERMRKRVVKITLVASILLTIFMYWLVFSYIRVYQNLWFLLMFIPFTLLYPPLGTLAQYEEKRKKYYNELKLEKEKILKNQLS